MKKIGGIELLLVVVGNFKVLDFVFKKCLDNKSFLNLASNFFGF